MSTHAQTLRTFFPWTQSPLLCAAPMRGATGSALAAAASNAGALAFYGLGYSVEDPVVLSDLAVTPTLLAPGVGFGIGFLLFKSSLPATLALLHLHRPAAVWFFCPRDPAQLVEWIHAVREAGVGGKVFVQIGSVQEVREMVEAGACPDVVVGQGSGDAGGHGRALGGSWSVLVPELRDYLSRVGKGEVPVFGAGGIMDGRGVVGVLAVGGSGAVLGTVVSRGFGAGGRGGLT